MYTSLGYYNEERKKIKKINRNNIHRTYNWVSSLKLKQDTTTNVASNLGYNI